jgi:hypothetical protein
MKALTVRLPEELAAEIEAEASERKVSKSDVVRERLERGQKEGRRVDPLHMIRDLVGSVEGLPPDLSSRKKMYLKATDYGRKRPR